MLGSLTAILLAGTLNYVGKRFPRLTGEGHLQPGGHDELLREEEDQGGQADVTTIAAVSPGAGMPPGDLQRLAPSATWVGRS